MLTINKSIHNQTSKHFANKDQEVVVVLVGARGTKQGGLWRLLIDHDSSKEKLSCSFVEFFLSNSRVVASGMSMA
jgi:hypothetical protein